MVHIWELKCSCHLKTSLLGILLVCMHLGLFKRNEMLSKELIPVHIVSGGSQNPCCRKKQVEGECGICRSQPLKKANPLWEQTTLKLFPGCTREGGRMLKFWEHLYFLNWASVEALFKNQANMFSISKPTSSIFSPWNVNLSIKEFLILTTDSIKQKIVQRAVLGRDTGETEKYHSQVLGTRNLLVHLWMSGPRSLIALEIYERLIKTQKINLKLQMPMWWVSILPSCPPGDDIWVHLPKTYIVLAIPCMYTLL